MGHTLQWPSSAAHEASRWLSFSWYSCILWRGCTRHVVLT